MAAVLSLLVIFHNKWVTLVRFNITAISTEIREGLPLFLSFAATSIYTACFVVILGLTASPTEVGCYSATDRIMRAFLCLSLTPILQSFYPKISRMGKENQAEALSLVHKLFVFVICAMLILGICLFSCSFWIINLLGIGYKGTENLFRIMAFIPIFVGIGGVIGQLKLLALGNSNDKKHFESAYFIACVVAILGVSLLSALFKAEGTAIALLATEMTVASVMVMFDLKRT
jgi:PST family polysaccharide transporter